VSKSVSAGTATVRYFGGAKTAAGIRTELVAVRVGATVDGLIAALAEARALAQEAEQTRATVPVGSADRTASLPTRTGSG
jgi:hypothetical protein